MTCAAAVRQGWEGAHRFLTLLGMTVKSIWRVQMLDGGERAERQEGRKPCMRRGDVGKSVWRARPSGGQLRNER